MTSHTEEELQAVGKEAQRQVKLALKRMYNRGLKKNDLTAFGIAMGVGGMIECGALVHAAAIPETLPVVEQIVLAYVRGAIRGAGGPVADNGDPFVMPNAA
jgi:hypothetical protein